MLIERKTHDDEVTMFEQNDGLGNITEPLVTQVLTALKKNEHRSISLEETDNLDAIAAVAVHDLWHHQVKPSKKMRHRIGTIANLVHEKYRGWETGTDAINSTQLNARGKLFFGYLHSLVLPTKKRVEFVKRYLREGVTHPFFVEAVRRRERVLDDVDHSLVLKMQRISPTIVKMGTVITGEKYCNQLVFYGFASAPVVIIQTVLQLAKGKILPMLVIAAYDRRYLDMEMVFKELRKTLPTLKEEVYTHEVIKVLQPPIMIYKLFCSAEHFNNISKVVERHCATL
ncbi:MAG: hypothetical protein OXB96_00825 [Candidatus Kaiserbacteria bacterium]|nr:hypothetical protein [Candidatus Kaiserbacteria bacterium]